MQVHGPRAVRARAQLGRRSMQIITRQTGMRTGPRHEKQRVDRIVRDADFIVTDMLRPVVRDFARHRYPKAFRPHPHRCGQ